jgi:flagellar basal body L-ring protein FlgH
MKVKNVFFLCSLLLLTSCSSFVEGMYRDLDRQERTSADEEYDNSMASTDKFDQFRKKRRTSTEYNRPGKNRDVSTNSQKLVNPGVKRQYQDEKVALKRTTASDLTDNGTDGSLWSGSDPNAFLFSTSRSKNSGDIVQINVLAKLRNEITMELKRAFPDNPYEMKAKAEGDVAKGPSPSSTPVAKDSGAEIPADGGAQDKISGVVVEEINREHLLIKGRKNVLFKNRKRMVEVQALVSRKDITDDDAVSSDAILESNVTVVR